MQYLIQSGKLDNTVHTIGYEQLKILYKDNKREERECRRVTESTYRGESYWSSKGNINYEMNLEYLYRDPRTSGFRMYYPHGVVISQSERKNYYRGENQIFSSSVPSLLRSLNRYRTLKERELYRLIADMRIAEFSFFLQKFQHVREWTESDILYEALAQHYGLETGWLDITSDFNVALFFATCYWNADINEWRPLTSKQTEVDENHQYGMIFHMPSYVMTTRWSDIIAKLHPFTDKPDSDAGNENIRYGRLEHPIYRGEPVNVIYPLGFQPFMRCHMQNGYGTYMRNPYPLQQDIGFEKLRFRHSEKLSRQVFDMMQGGELIYPHEGLKEVMWIIDDIRRTTMFSEEAFQYALYRSHYYRIVDRERALDDLSGFTIDGKSIEITDKHPWKLSAGRRKRIDEKYQAFSVETAYDIRIMDRKCIPGPGAMYEPWMLPSKDDGIGICDFKARETVDCGMSIAVRNSMSLLQMVYTAKTVDF